MSDILIAEVVDSETDETTIDDMDPVEADDAAQGDRDDKMVGIVPTLGELGDGAVIFEMGLARLFERHPASIRRAVDRGELPRPVRLLGRPAWTAGTIRRHFEARLAAVEREAEKTRERVTRLRP